MYSQNLEETYILAYFKGKTGTFLDIGSNDGKTFSNVRALMELKWKGCCVEPSPTAYAMLKENTKDFEGVYCYPYALGVTNGILKFHDSGSHLGKDDHGLLSTLSEQDYNKWRSTTQFNEIEVQCFRWKTFLNRLMIKEFDFISIDAEGKDIDILKQISLYKTKLLCIEWNSIEDIKKQILEYTSGFGMNKVIYTSGENILICR